MTEHPKIKIVKKDARPQTLDEYIKRHEDSLLALWIERSPERAREILRRIDESLRRAA